MNFKTLTLISAVAAVLVGCTGGSAPPPPDGKSMTQEEIQAARAKQIEAQKARNAQGGE